MFRTEESRVAIVVLLTFALLLVAGMFEAYVAAGAIGITFFIVLYAVYAVLVKKKKGEQQDERSARCSLLATRNGFIAVILSIAALVALEAMSAPLTAIDTLRIVWMAGVTVYLLSYLYYKKVT